MLRQRTELEKQRRRAQEAAKRQRVRRLRDERPRCPICSELVYGRSGVHPQCMLRTAEARVPE